MVGALQNPYQKYLKTKIETASQPQLLVMLFDAAVKKLHTAKRAIGGRKIEEAHTNLVKVQKIFSELMVALDFDMGGDLAKQLFSIYEFVHRRLVDANISQDTAIIDEVLPIVDQLREGWTAAVAKFEEDPEAARAEAQAAKAAKAQSDEEKAAQQAALQASAPEPGQSSGFSIASLPSKNNYSAPIATPAKDIPDLGLLQPSPQAETAQPQQAGPNPAPPAKPAQPKNNVTPLRPMTGYGPAPKRPTPPKGDKPDEDDRPRLNLQG